MGSHFLFHWYLKSFNLIEKQQQNLNNRLTVCLCSLAAEQQQRVYVYRHHTGVSKVPTFNRWPTFNRERRNLEIFSFCLPHEIRTLTSQSGTGIGRVEKAAAWLVLRYFLQHRSSYSCSCLSARNFKSCTISKSVVDQSQRLVQKYLRLTCFIHFKYRSC